DEIEARDRALADSRLREADDRIKAEADAQRRAAEDARRAADREAAEARKKEEETRRTQEEESRKKAEDAAKKRLGEETAPAAGPRGRAAVAEEDETRRAPIRRPGMPARPVAPPKPERTKAGQEKQRGRLTLTTAFESEEERARSVAAFRRRVQRMTGKVSA